MKALNICIRGNTVLPPDTTLPCPHTAPPAPVMTTDSASTSGIPAAPDIGCARNFVHKVKVDLTVKPSLQSMLVTKMSKKKKVSTCELEVLVGEVEERQWILFGSLSSGVSAKKKRYELLEADEAFHSCNRS
ncbi:uncharacterized protein V6R79_015886 [Siganus canaliculatus]